VTDLRAFLADVRKRRPADVVEVEREVDPRYETAAIVTKLEERGRSPILIFKHVKGTDRTVVTNVCGSMGRLAFALDCSLKDVARVYGEKAARPVAPRIIDGAAPCQEVIKRGDEVDLGVLPPLQYHLDDADEPYITAAIVLARDPQTARTNLSYHRLMVAGRDRTGILMEKGRHLDGIFNKYAAAGKDMPIAAFIGAHPLWALGALYSGSAHDEEYDVIGGLLGEALPLARCVTHEDLSVPAGTELVLEGVVTHDERMREGPFGEFTGYGTGITETPVFRVQAMTHRADFLFQDIVSGRMEHLVLSMPALEERTRRVATRAAPGVDRIALVAPLTAVVSLNKTSDDEPKRVIEALLRSDIYSKHVIVVDADVDPGDLRAVMSAMALQTQADRHVTILAGELGTPLDPSCPDPGGRSAKMGIDATRSLAPVRAATKNRLPQDLLDRIDVKEFKRRG
jgi:UbiD family decarboxylase